MKGMGSPRRLRLLSEMMKCLLPESSLKQNPVCFPAPVTNKSQPCLRGNTFDRSPKASSPLQSEAQGTGRRRNAAGGCGCLRHSADPLQLCGLKTSAANSSCHCSPCWQQGISGRDEFLSPELSSSVLSSKDATALTSIPSCCGSEVYNMVSGIQFKRSWWQRSTDGTCA